VGLVLNGGIMWVLRVASKSDINVRSAFVHMLGDLLGSIGIIVGAVAISYTGWVQLDPLLSMLIGGFASLTLLTKNSFLDQIGQQYVLTARAKGLSERRVLYGHVFRNAMLIVISGFPGALINILFTGALLTEVIFSIDGIGLLGFQAALSRDYPVMFGTLYCFTLLGLAVNLIEDLTYMLVDPRIDFARRET